MPSRPVARIFRAVGPAPWPTSRPLAEVRAAARRLAQQLVVGQPGDGEAVVASEHVAAQPRVVVTADPGDFQDLEVAGDGPLGRTQGGGQGPGVAGRSLLEQLQQLEDAGGPTPLILPPPGVGPPGPCCFFPALGLDATHQCPSPFV